SRPTGDATGLALILAGAASAPLLFAGLSATQLLSADIAAALAAFAITWLAKRQIGGYTGDVLGAAQQAAEIAVLLALSAK
ncbi:MAG: adenosylcobinamide-GDP ribazoletransferase, partial [Methylocystis sp.]